jgi:hypothetical protein
VSRSGGPQGSRRRARSALLGVTIAAGALGLTGGVAGASAPPALAAPGGGPPACETMPLTTTSDLVPGAALSLGLDCPALQVERLYSARFTTGGVAIAAAYPYEDGRIAFPEVFLPQDWPIPGFHTIELYDASTGETVGTSDLYVNEAGSFEVLPAGAPEEHSPDLRERVRETGLLTSRGEAAVKAAAVLLVGVAFALRTRGGRTGRRSREGRRGAGWARQLSSRS